MPRETSIQSAKINLKRIIKTFSRKGNEMASESEKGLEELILAKIYIFIIHVK